MKNKNITIKHMMDVVQQFHKVVERIETLKLQIVKECKVKYTSQDARMVALDSIQMEISVTGMWITVLNSLANKCMLNSGTLDEKEFLKSVGSNLSIKDTEIHMMNSLRLGFMTLVHFKIDNLFQNVLRELKSTPKSWGYLRLCNAILKEASLPTDKMEKDILTVFANLRNSLHGNGIHRTENLNIRLSGLDFHFEKGKKVKCASWHHIIVALDNNINVLEKILLSDKVKKITHEIKDDFASTLE